MDPAYHFGLSTTGAVIELQYRQTYFYHIYIYFLYRYSSKLHHRLWLIYGYDILILYCSCLDPGDSSRSLTLFNVTVCWMQFQVPTTYARHSTSMLGLVELFTSLRPEEWAFKQLLDSHQKTLSLLARHHTYTRYRFFSHLFLWCCCANIYSSAGINSSSDCPEAWGQKTSSWPKAESRLVVRKANLGPTQELKRQHQIRHQQHKLHSLAIAILHLVARTGTGEFHTSNRYTTTFNLFGQEFCLTSYPAPYHHEPPPLLSTGRVEALRPQRPYLDIRILTISDHPACLQASSCFQSHNTSCLTTLYLLKSTRSPIPRIGYIHPRSSLALAIYLLTKDL